MGALPSCYTYRWCALVQSESVSVSRQMAAHIKSGSRGFILLSFFSAYCGNCWVSVEFCNISPLLYNVPWNNVCYDLALYKQNWTFLKSNRQRLSSDLIRPLNVIPGLRSKQCFSLFVCIISLFPHPFLFLCPDPHHGTPMLLEGVRCLGAQRDAHTRHSSDRKRTWFTQCIYKYSFTRIGKYVPCFYFVI